MTRGDNPSSTCAGQSPGYAGLAALELSAMTVPVTRDGTVRRLARQSSGADCLVWGSRAASRGGKRVAGHCPFRLQDEPGA